jgi:FkbM family methyltransferase
MRLKRLVRANSHRLARWSVRQQGLVGVLNAAYDRAPYAQKEWLYHLFSKAFRGFHRPGTCTWDVRFGRRTITLPLQGSQMWLHWDLAFSILGHDVEIKRSYETFLSSRQPPRVFFDVGANYGLDSLLLLSQGITTVSFEPNPACHAYFLEAARLNGVCPRIEAVALGRAEGRAQLSFYADETWNGSLLGVAASQLTASPNLSHVAVRVTSLDTFVRDSGLQPDLIKMDVEGNELNVLSGAMETLRQAQPWVIFESNTADDRAALRALFDSVGYRVARLPLLDAERPTPLSLDAFIASRSTNFLSFPGGLLPRTTSAEQVARV